VVIVTAATARPAGGAGGRGGERQLRLAHPSRELEVLPGPRQLTGVKDHGYNPEHVNFNTTDWRSLCCSMPTAALLTSAAPRPDTALCVRARPGPLSANGAAIGTLVLHRANYVGLLGVFSGLLIPVLIISFFTGLLTLLIGFLLARRVVTPLADVVAAAQRVAAGDLTARVQVRGPGDLRSLSDSFNRMAGALEVSDQQRRDLLADIAHELRTPLTIIRGKLEGMLDGVYPADEDHVARAGRGMCWSGWWKTCARSPWPRRANCTLTRSR
jgi:HAMP domain-containing protein